MTFLADLVTWFEGVQSTVAVFIAEIAAGMVTWWAISNMDSGPAPDIIFALGVVVGTTAASFDAWSYYHAKKGRRAVAGLHIWATALTWLGLAIACCSATSSGSEPLLPSLAIEFFVTMSMLSLLGGWCFAWLSNNAPDRPSKMPSFSLKAQSICG